MKASALKSSHLKSQVFACQLIKVSVLKTQENESSRQAQHSALTSAYIYVITFIHSDGTCNWSGLYYLFPW